MVFSPHLDESNFACREQPRHSSGKLGRGEIATVWVFGKNARRISMWRCWCVVDIRTGAPDLLQQIDELGVRREVAHRPVSRPADVQTYRLEPAILEHQRKLFPLPRIVGFCARQYPPIRPHLDGCAALESHSDTL